MKSFVLPLCLCLLFSCSFSAFLSFDFAPNQAQSIPNPLGSQISLNCKLSTSDASDSFFGIMKSGSGSVNGQAVPASGIPFTIKNGDVVNLVGSAGSDVSITNKGASTVHADCDLAFVQTKKLRNNAPNSFLSFDFAPNQAESIPNPLGSQISLNCKLSTSDASDSFFGIMKSGTGSINGQAVPASGITFTIKNGEVVNLVGSAGSDVSITNKGASTVHADCDLASVEAKNLRTVPNGFLSFDFTPNQAQSIPNPLGSTISLKCTLTGSDAADNLFGVLKSGSGSVNGQTIPSQGLSFTVHNGDIVSLVASAGSELSITNKGASTVHADCNLASVEAKNLRTVPNGFLSFDFTPNQAQSIPNPLGSTISLKCTLTGSDAADNLFGVLKSGSGSVNGQTIPSQGLTFTVHNGDVVSLVASAGSELSITNKGASTVHADCNLASFEAKDLRTVPNGFLSFDFTPNQAQSIPNPLGSTISLKCTITGSDAADNLFGVLKSGSGSVNGQTIPSQGLTFTVHNGDVISLVASAGSELSITNQGSNTVHADCNLASVEAKNLRTVPNGFLSFDFPSNQAQSIPYLLGSTISLKCTLTGSDAADNLFGVLKSGSGSVNGQTIPSQGLTFTVHNGDVVSLVASAGSELSITNQGSNTVHADCNLASVEAKNLRTVPNGFLSFDFPSNQAQSIPNPLGSTISLKCTLTGSDATDNLFGVLKSGSGSVNGQTIPSQGLTFVVHNGDVVTLVASAGSELSITNQGSNTVHADCNLASLSAVEESIQLQESAQTNEAILIDAFESLLQTANDFSSIDLVPNTPQTISNPLFFGISATCTISTPDASDNLTGQMSSGTGTLNGQTIPSGGLQLSLKNGDSLSLTASAYAGVVITNLGASTVHASCGLSAVQQYKNFLQSGVKGRVWEELLAKIIKKRNI